MPFSRGPFGSASASFAAFAVASLAGCAPPASSVDGAEGARNDAGTCAWAASSCRGEGSVADGGDAGDAAESGAVDGGPAPFVHPGVLSSRASLDFVKGKIAAGAEPWSGALTAAAKSRWGSLTYSPSPVATVQCGPYSNPDVGCTAEKDDASAAYTQALLYYFTGKAAHAEAAIAIMNAWSAVLVDHTLSNAPLQSAWVASVWPRAAEIIRYTYDGWAAADVARFSKMLRDVYLPKVIHGSASNGNWELSMIEASAAMGVFLDDRAVFDAAVAMWRERVPAYVYVASDGPYPVKPPRGNVTTTQQLVSFWYGQSTFMDGLSQETCRDLGHVQYGLAAMINAAETAHVQGVDLYAEEQTRIVAGLEFHSRLLEGGAVPSALCGGTLNAVVPDPMWEIALNEYAGRRQASLPNTATLVSRIRPTGVDHHMDWETLTHANSP